MISNLRRQRECDSFFGISRSSDECDMDDDDFTQPATQQVLDPRRLGRNNSGLADNEVANVLCILHPSSPAAFRAVESTEQHNPQHVLQYGVYRENEHDDPALLEEQDTFILSQSDGKQTQADNERRLVPDIALRFSAKVVSPSMGFVFGRNAALCDVLIGIDAVKRVSNRHFRIFVNSSGIVMLEDTSTNGTLVDDVLLKGKDPKCARTRMLNPGSVIQILSPKMDEAIKFILRIPPREGHERQYAENFQRYMARVAQHRPDTTPFNVPGGSNQPMVNNSYQHGMHWNGGEAYNIVGQLGKGAFATVYKLATAMDGQLLAAKELEKKRFVKNGQLDQRLDNEMRIMQTLRHPNIVQYVDYRDYDKYLYIIMEYVPCGDLQGWLGLHGVLPEQWAKRMAFQILQALAYLHVKNITHRDIKPDNILIASEDPFDVKLSDFGLSKVVKNNDTFLKTFCGTLLYCAPEVFPHYDTYAQGKGKRRKPGSTGRQNFHSYSQSVDVWSFAAVLWNSLCGSPPFEGVVDQTGRGMFEKIMSTPLDTRPLQKRNISPDAIDLLLKMLNTNPAERLTELQCLRHPWFADLNPNGDVGTEFGAARDLDTIEEVDDLDADVGAEEDAEERFSQLSIHARQARPDDDAGSYGEEVILDSGDFPFFDPRQSKRVKTDRLYPRNQPRDQSIASSSPEVSYDDIVHEDANGDSPTLPRANLRANRLFGEIGQSALQSSGLLDMETTRALTRDASTSMEDEANSRNMPPTEPASSGMTPSQAEAAKSLLGAESMVREMNMASPNSPNSAGATPNEPTTPRTPESANQANSSNSGLHDITPKAPVTSFNRQIILKKTASFFYDPENPATHTLEYASRVSGYDFVAEAEAEAGATEPDLASMPPTMDPLASGRSEQSAAERSPQHRSHTPTTEAPSRFSVPPPVISRTIDLPPMLSPQTVQAEFIRPPPRLGKLTATADSFEPITLHLTQRITSWGRNPNSVIVYHNPNEVRVPKQAFNIAFHAPGIEEHIKDSQTDWTKLDGLHTLINTGSSIGISINGVHLRRESDDGRVLFGRLYDGDVVEIAKSGHGKGLKFICEFWHGEAKEKRKEDAPGFEILRGPPLVAPAP